ncbi:MAG: Hpt domain-containing protein, partial [Deltaproteobacteria bacterium]|nr:Hpt domain-containing protein [Candidatus Anaeroferrophillacea bacterium]
KKAGGRRTAITAGAVAVAGAAAAAASPVSAGEGPVWNRQSLLDRLMNDDKLAAMIVAGFLADIPVQLERLREMAARNDVAAVERQAHTIKGAAANIGGDALGNAAAAVEQAARKGDLPTAADMLAAVEEAFDRLRREMEVRREK